MQSILKFQGIVDWELLLMQALSGHLLEIKLYRGYHQAFSCSNSQKAIRDDNLGAKSIPLYLLPSST